MWNLTLEDKVACVSFKFSSEHVNWERTIGHVSDKTMQKTAPHKQPHTFPQSCTHTRTHWGGLLRESLFLMKWTVSKGLTRFWMNSGNHCSALEEHPQAPLTHYTWIYLFILWNKSIKWININPNSKKISTIYSNGISLDSVSSSNSSWVSYMKQCTKA